MNGDGVPASTPYPLPSLESEGGARPSPPRVRTVQEIPASLRHLLLATTTTERDAAWEAFIGDYSRLLLHVAHGTSRSRDETMDAYGFLLERLQRDDFHVLRNYAAQDGSKFTTWLVVVARRMCVDFRRQRFGRPRSAPDGAVQVAERLARWQLARLTGGSATLRSLVDERTTGPEEAVRVRQMYGALERAIASLRPDDQLLLRLRYDDGHSVPRIARLLKAPTPFHVYRRLTSVLAVLRRALIEQGIEDSAP